MKIDGLSAKAGQFEYRNHDLALSSDDGVLVRLIELDGRIGVFIDVDEEVRAKDLERAIPLAHKWRDRLLDYQAPFTGLQVNLFLDRLDLWHKNGDTYRQIADRINRQIRDDLNQYVEFVRELDSTEADVSTVGGYFSWSAGKPGQFGVDRARGLLQAIRWKEKDDEFTMDELLQNALNDIAAGIEPFADEYPVSKSRVENTLRSWKHSSKYERFFRYMGGSA